jgi:hypothetical protein
MILSAKPMEPKIIENSRKFTLLTVIAGAAMAARRRTESLFNCICGLGLGGKMTEATNNRAASARIRSTQQISLNLQLEMSVRCKRCVRSMFRSRDRSIVIFVASGEE